MQDIDFLPLEFKKRRTTRHARSWRVLLALLVPSLIVAAAVFQSRTRRQIEDRLALIAPQRRQIDEQQIQLAVMQKELASAEARVELLTYFEHPWPKTQLLAAILSRLPEPVVFSKIHITPENQPGRSSVRNRAESESKELQALDPALRDLYTLCQQWDATTLVATLEGTTTDGLALHRYLDQLHDAALLDQVELRSLEAVPENDGELFRFEARLTVRYGFGQTDGPTRLDDQLAQTDPTAAPGPEANQP
jgi:hypothetical protein